MEDKYQCRTCQRKFDSFTDRYKHEKTKHGTSKDKEREAYIAGTITSGPLGSHSLNLGAGTPVRKISATDRPRAISTITPPKIYDRDVTSRPRSISTYVSPSSLHSLSSTLSSTSISSSSSRRSTSPTRSSSPTPQSTKPSHYQAVGESSSNGNGAESYYELLSSQLRNTDKILWCQNFNCRGQFSACFGPSREYQPAPHTCWTSRGSYDSALTYVKDQWDARPLKNIHSISGDDIKGFGIYCMEGYGGTQALVPISTDLAKIQAHWDDEKMITSCCAVEDSFYLVMTQGVKEYNKKAQDIIKCSTWKECQQKINDAYRKKLIISSMCYSTGLQQYFIVLTGSSEAQVHKRFGGSDHTVRADWVKEQYRQGHHITILFSDPATEEIFVVMTADKTRDGCGYSTRINYEIK